MVKRYGTCRVREFGPTKLKNVRQDMIDQGLFAQYQWEHAGKRLHPISAR